MDIVLEDGVSAPEAAQAAQAALDQDHAPPPQASSEVVGAAGAPYGLEENEAGACLSTSPAATHNDPAAVFLSWPSDGGLHFFEQGVYMHAYMHHQSSLHQWLASCLKHGNDI
jgi:hypothetical protein